MKKSQIVAISWAIIGAIPLQFALVCIGLIVINIFLQRTPFACIVDPISGMEACGADLFASSSFFFVIVSNIAYFGVPTIVAVIVIYFGIRFLYHPKNDY
jgi:hypothetical protein